MPRNKETTSRRLSYGSVFFNLFLPSLGAAFYRLIIPRGTRVQRTTGKKCHRPPETNASLPFRNGRRKLAAVHETHALLSRLLSVDFVFRPTARGADANTKEHLLGQYSQCATSKRKCESLGRCLLAFNPAPCAWTVTDTPPSAAGPVDGAVFLGDPRP